MMFLNEGEKSILLGDRLVELRKIRKETQEQTAHNLGLTRSAYSQYELGTRNPDQDTLIKMANHFDKSIDYLLGRGEKESGLGSKLKQARENKRLTQQDVANKLGVSNGAISGYERGYRDPDTDMLNRLADLYEVSLDWLSGRSEKGNEYTLPEDVMLKIMKEAEAIHGVSLQDDPVVESAVRDLMNTLARMKKANQNKD